MRLAGLNPTSLFDGVGVNYVVFFQGCRHRCPHCHNPSTWDFNGGIEMCHEHLQSRIKKFLPIITGITLSGGDPIYQLDDALMLAEWAKTLGLNVTLYTGFSFKELLEQNVPLVAFDYIFDGLFVKAQASVDIPFRGSVNQQMWRRENNSWFCVDGSARR